MKHRIKHLLILVCALACTTFTQQALAAAKKSKAAPVNKGVLYQCEGKKSFNLEGNPELDNNLKLHYGKKTVIVTKLETETGVNRFSHAESGLDILFLPAKTMLLDTINGLRIADECQPKASNPTNKK